MYIILYVEWDNFPTIVNIILIFMCGTRFGIKLLVISSWLYVSTYFSFYFLIDLL